MPGTPGDAAWRAACTNSSSYRFSRCPPPTHPPTHGWYVCRAPAAMRGARLAADGDHCIATPQGLTGDVHLLGQPCTGGWRGILLTLMQLQLLVHCQPRPWLCTHSPQPACALCAVLVHWPKVNGTMVATMGHKQNSLGCRQWWYLPHELGRIHHLHREHQQDLLNMVGFVAKCRATHASHPLKLNTLPHTLGTMVLPAVGMLTVALHTGCILPYLGCCPWGVSQHTGPRSVRTSVRQAEGIALT